MNKTNLIVGGLLLGTVVFETIYIFHLKKPSGVLKIDHKSEKDVYLFETDDLDTLSKKKYIMLKVDNNADLSHD